MPALHQFVAGFSQGDAISNEARTLRRIFRDWGYTSDIICEQQRTLPELRRETRDLAAALPTIRPEDIVLLHLSIGSPVNEAFRLLQCGKAILYHNITPPEFFRDIHEPMAAQLAQGREQVKSLAGVAAVNLAVSAFNAMELEELGYAQVGVLPLVLDFAKLRAAPHRGRLARYADGLTHVGSYAGLENYQALLWTRIRQLQLANVELTGSIPQAELNACYQSAHVFLCLSEHEGFCIPLIEAMVNEVPVLAYAAGAVPETLDGAGVLIKEKRFDLVAEMLGRLVHDETLRDAVLAKQRERVDIYEHRDLETELRAHLAPLIEPDTKRVSATP